MAIRHVALRYLTAFRCLGADCEDNCCHDWSVAVDREHYGAIKRALSVDADGRARFARSLALAPANQRTRDRFALVTLDDADACRLLDGKLCSLHARFGEALLPDACAIYPRVLSADGERHELSAELSCPEVARRCLTAADGTDLVPCPPELAGRATVGQRSSDANPPYLRYNGAIRGALYRLLGRVSFSVDERLFFLACFAIGSSEFFTRDTTRLDGARLTEELRLIEDETGLTELARHFATLDGAPEIVTEALGGMLAAWLSEHCAPRFRQLVRASLESLAAAPGARGETMQVDPAWLSRAYQSRKAALAPLCAARLDEIFTRYCRQFVIRHWYTDAPDLPAYAQQLLLRVATARLLVYCHPRLAPLAAVAPVERAPIVDAAAVEVIYALTRALEHSLGSLRTASLTLRDKLPSLAHAVALIKL